MRKKHLLCIILLAAMICLSAVACKKEPAELTPGPESGIYYCETNGKDNLITLSDGNKLSFSIAEEIKSGTYKLDGEKLTFDFYKKNEPQQTATLKNDIISLKYEQTEMEFLKKQYFTVDFDTDGGSPVDTVSVLNGKTIQEPSEEPTRGTDIFIGWYIDDEFTDPFPFGTRRVISDLTLHAFWVPKPNQTEFTVDFDLNYSDAGRNPDARETLGGKMYNLPRPEREGYTFKGWWISMFDNVNKLTYPIVEAATVLKEHTTLFALWQSNTSSSKLRKPLVKVDYQNNRIEWEGVGASSYRYRITGPAGFVEMSDEQGSTTLAVPFSTSPEGEYTIKVTAIAPITSNNSDDTERSFNNKALARVSLFDVVAPSILTFKGVEAEKYFITVDCGDASHNHTDIDISTRNYYNFASCTMRTQGIRFTVTAFSEGMASSTSRVYTHHSILDKITEFVYEESTQTLWWNSVSYATNYVVSITCGDVTHKKEHELFNNGNKTSYSLKECSPRDEGILINVYPTAKGYNSPAPSLYKCYKTILATPRNIHIEGMTIKWIEVPGAESYEVIFGSHTYTPEDNFCVLPDDIEYEKNVELIVRAIAKTEDDNSFWSDPIMILDTITNVSYNEGVVSWDYIFGAVHYLVKVNDEPVKVNDEDEPGVVSNSVNSVAVSLTQAGKNTIEVSFYNGTIYSEGVSIQVVAYSISYNTDGGDSIDPKYIAEGDIIPLPEAIKAGSTFAGWYTASGNTGNKYNTGDKLSGQRNLTLYAHWTVNDYDLTYSYGGGDAPAGSNGFGNVKYGQNYILEVPVIENGYLFLGWYEKQNGEGTRYTDELGKSRGPWLRDEENVTVYAFFAEVLTYRLITLNSGRQGYSVGRRIGYNLINQISSLTIPSAVRLSQDTAKLPVAVIYANAFDACASLVTISLPDNMESVAPDAFPRCTNLTNFIVYHVPGTNDPTISSIDGVLFTNVFDDNYNIVNYLIVCYPIKKTGDFTLPAGIKAISYQMFAGLYNLTKITLHAGVTNIYNYAFDGCTNLKEVVIPSGSALQSIGQYAFRGCVSLTGITIPKNVKDVMEKDYEDNIVTTAGIGLGAFSGCVNLKTVEFETGGAEALTIPTATTGNGVFYNCSSLTVFTIPSRLRYIGNFTFEGCANLEKVNYETGGPEADELIIGSDVLNASVFKGLTKLTSVAIPKRTTFIANNTFLNCTGLNKVEFEKGGDQPLTLSGSGASSSQGVFSGCTGIASIEIPNRTVFIGNYAFANCSLTTLTFEKGGDMNLTIGNSAFYNCGFSELEISNRVTSIVNSAFSGCSSLTTVTFETGGKEELNIGINIFVGCSNIKEITFPGRVVELTYQVFTQTTGTPPSGLSKLEKIEVEAIAGAQFKSIDGVLFTKDNMLVYYPRAKIVETETGIVAYTIPDWTTGIGDYAFNGYTLFTGDFTIASGITYIGAYAFNGNSMSSVTIKSASALAIGNAAFRNCTSLTTVVFAGAGAVTLGTGGNVFTGCSKLESITFGGTGAVNLGNNAVSGITSLTKLIFRTGSGVVTIAGASSASYGGFYNCTNLDTLDFQEGCGGINIGAYAFSGCTKLVALKTPTFKGDQAITIAQNAFGTAYVPTSITFEGDAVVTLGANAFNGKTSLISVTFNGDGSINIGDNAFNGCTGLTSVIFDGDGSINIGAGAFKGCTVLQDIDFPLGIASIGANAFENCTSFEEVIFLDESRLTAIGANAFAGCTGLTGVYLPENLISFDGNAFTGCSGLASVTVARGNTTFASSEGVVYSADFSRIVYYPRAKTGELVLSNITSLGANVFKDNKNIIAVTIPVTVISIGDSAFEGCTNLIEVIFASDAAAAGLSLGTRVFAGCTALSIVSLASHLENINDHTFYGCSLLTSITIPDSVTRIGVSAFEGSNLTSIEIPAGVVDIGKSAFANVATLQTVTFTTGPGAELIIEAGTHATNAGVQGAFAGCTGLTSLILTDRLKNIPDYTFYGCNNAGFTSVDLQHAENVGLAAFYNCTNLASVTFANLKTIANANQSSTGAFARTNLTSVRFPASMVSVGSYAFYTCGNLKTVMFVNTATIGGYVFAGSALETVTLMNVTSIGDGAFEKCTGLKTIDLKNVTSIGYKAFACSGLLGINIPALTKMSTSVFEGCANLGSASFSEDFKLTVPGATFGPYTVDSNTVINCNQLELIDFGCATGIGANVIKGCTNLKSITIPKTVTSISNNAFNGCTQLTEVIFESGATAAGLTIEDGASTTNGSTTTITGVFLGCTNLTKIVFPSQLKQIGAYAFYGCTSLTEVTYNDEDSALSQLTSVNVSAFEGCIALKKVAFKDGAATTRLIFESVSTSAYRNTIFLNCADLEEVKFPDHLASIAGRGLFAGSTKLRTVNIPKSLISFNIDIFAGCSALEEILVDPDNSYYKDIDGVLFTKDGALKFYPAGKANAYIIPDGTTTIDQYAFDIGASLTSGTSIPFTAGTNDRLTKITIPGSVTRINIGAFRRCTALTEIEWLAGTDNLTIADGTGLSGTSSNGVFIGCTGLRVIDFPARLHYVGAYAFQSLSLTRISFAKNTVAGSYLEIGEYAFSSSGLAGDVIDGETIDGVTFADNINLIKIGNLAFYRTTLKSIRIPAALETIGDQAFYYCTGLESLKFETGSRLTKIGASAFYYCTSLGTIGNIPDKINIPETITEFGNSAFYNCGSFTGSITLKGVEAFGNAVFANCTNLTEIIITGTLTSIGNAFYGCKELVALSLPRTVESIGDSSSATTGAFVGCSKLKTITANDGFDSKGALIIVSDTEDNTFYFPNLTRIGAYACYGLTTLKKVVAPNLTSVGSNAFYGCTGLTSINLANATSIGSSAFYNCGSLIYFNSSDTDSGKLNITSNGEVSLAGAAFYGCTGLKEVNIQGTSITLTSSSAATSVFYGCTGLAKVTLNGSETITISNYAFSGRNSLTDLTIEGTAAVTINSSSGSAAFLNCSNLQNVSITGTAITISSYAFYNCGTTNGISLEVSITGTVITIGTGTTAAASVFYGCTNLKTVTIEGGTIAISNYTFSGRANLTSVTLSGTAITVGTYAFQNCTKLTGVLLSGTAITIGANAFAGCTGLTSIIIPESVTSIGAGAFTGWTAAQNIYIIADAVPARWDANWNGGSANVQTGYVVPPPEEDGE